MFMTAFITAVAAYLLGSVNFAVIFTKLFSGKDVRKVGSGNAGATNALRAGGTVAGMLTFVCDCLKGVLSALLGYFMFSYIFAKTGSTLYLPVYGAYFCGIFAMLGHVFPLFYQFKGGKGVSTGVGVIFVTCPIAAAVGLAVFAAFVFITKIVSLSSLIATFSVVVLAMILYTRTNDALFLPQAIMAVIIGAIIFLKHTPNIKRLLSGEEPKFGVRR